MSRSKIQYEEKPTEAEIDEEVAAFERGLVEKGLETLAKPERAILKTFLIWKMHQPYVVASTT